jgi:hypothetical protein
MYQQQPFIPQYPCATPPTFPTITPSGTAAFDHPRGVSTGDNMCRNLFSSTSHHTTPSRHSATVHPSSALTPGYAALVPSFSSEGSLTPELYAFTYPPHSDLPSVGTFETPQSKFTDPITFVVNFRERMRLFGYLDTVLC